MPEVDGLLRVDAKLRLMSMSMAIFRGDKELRLQVLSIAVSVLFSASASSVLDP
jgi:hypothetical protein